MKIEELQPGQKLLIIRYGVDIEKDCISLHQQIITSKGYCWFGKIGIAPLSGRYTPVLQERNPAIVLYNKQGTYLCSFLDICFSKPVDGFPDYYRNAFFEKNSFPKCYFKLGSITELTKERLSDFYVVSSGNDALTTLNKCMTSFLYVSYNKLSDTELEKIQSKKGNMQKEVVTSLSVNDCIYRNDGTCTLKTCINYQYECDRPSMCAKQRR